MSYCAYCYISDRALVALYEVSDAEPRWLCPECEQEYHTENLEMLSDAILQAPEFRNLTDDELAAIVKGFVHDHT